VHTEYRDDRFVAAFQRDGSSKATFSIAYIVRAVTPGHYVLPPATIEDMYRPQRFGRTAFGSVDIAETK
jgi:alpha-2-macroglobulin